MSTISEESISLQSIMIDDKSYSSKRHHAECRRAQIVQVALVRREAASNRAHKGGQRLRVADMTESVHDTDARTYWYTLHMASESCPIMSNSDWRVTSRAPRACSKAAWNVTSSRTYAGSTTRAYK